jgi:L,D-transpeptidase catalytic domain
MNDSKDSAGHNKQISRRDFLKIGATGIFAALGFALPSRWSLDHFLNQTNYAWIKPQDSLDSYMLGEMLNPDQQGRVLSSSIDVYSLPSYSSNLVNTYYRDWVLPLTDITIGTSVDSFNMVWYKIGNEGYSHSGDLQPVMTKINPVIANIPPDGVLAEVTVPFTDARWNPGENELVAYRFYFATTFWVIDLVEDKNGKSWYAVRDDKWEYIYYVPAEHLRLIPREEMQPISPNVLPYNKRIEVHLPEQVMIAYEFDQPVFMARVATGARYSNGDFSTPTGRYMTFHKRSSRHMARGNLAANGYDLPGVPWNSYITEEGIAFHGTYWHNNFGRPRSHGCINLTPQAAKWVFLWTIPTVPPEQEGIYKEIGTSVDIVG